MSAQTELNWIAEARKHIGVKEIPGPKNNSVIQGWLRSLKAWWSDDATAWCFTGETEILTAEGWQRLDGITAGEVYQVDSLGGLSLTRFVPVSKSYTGDVIRVQHRSIDLICDPEHRWWGAWGKSSNPYAFGTLESMPNDGLAVPMGHSTAVGVPLSEDELTLLAAFISDGKIRWGGKARTKPERVEFEVSRTRKLLELTRLNPDKVYTQRRAYGPLTKTPLTVFSFKIPDWFLGCFDSYKRLRSDFINQMSQRQAQVFLSAYSMFDGNNGGPQASNLLYTSDPEWLGDLMRIAVLAGYHSSVQKRGGSQLSKREAYALVFYPGKVTRTIKPSHLSRQPYSGQLYCVSVPEGRIVVRGPRGGPVVVGNCGVYAAQVLQACKLSYPKDWYRAKAYLSLPVKLDKPAYGCIVVFDRAGGGHVGFVVGVDRFDNLMVLGGNQGDCVCIKPFSRDRVVGYRWPNLYPTNGRFKLPLLDSDGKVSENEA